jgi:RNA polymerase sigma factor (sigma-70 family)
MPDPDDTMSLLQRWHHGERDAVVSLIERDRAWVEERVRRSRGPLLRQHGETMDDFQDLMLRVLNYAPRFLCENRRQFRSLLARMVANLVVDKARHLSGRRHEVALGLESQSRLLLSSGAGQPGPLEAAARSEDLAWMRLGLEFLDDEERQVVWERQFEERTFPEIAARLGLQENAARMRFQRALVRLTGIVLRLRSGDLDGLLGEAEA